MFEYVSIKLIINLTLLILVISLFSSVVTLIFGFLFFRTIFDGKYISIFGVVLGSCIPLASIAAVSGYLTAMSREPAVTAVIPGILTLLGGISIYIISRRTREFLIVSNVVFVFSFTFLISVAYGSYVRETGLISRMIYLTEQERSLRIYRQNRGLPEEIPEWMLKNGN